MTDTLANRSSPIEIDVGTGKRIFQLKRFERDWGYAQALRVGNTIHVSGTVSMDAVGNPTAADDMAGQVRNVYADIAASLAAHGATLGNVVREALYTTNMDRFLSEGLPVRAEAYAGHALPASAPWVEVSRLANPAFLFEVEVTAMLPGD